MGVSSIHDAVNIAHSGDLCRILMFGEGENARRAACLWKKDFDEDADVKNDFCDIVEARGISEVFLPLS